MRPQKGRTCCVFVRRVTARESIKQSPLKRGLMIAIGRMARRRESVMHLYEHCK